MLVFLSVHSHSTTLGQQLFHQIKVIKNKKTKKKEEQVDSLKQEI